MTPPLSVLGEMLATIILCLVAMLAWVSHDRRITFVCVVIAILAVITLIALLRGGW